MKKIMVMLICLMLVLPAQAEDALKLGDRAQVVGCHEYISLREAPDVSAAEITKLQLNESVNVIGTAESGFAELQAGEYRGFTAAEYLEISNDYTGSPVQLTPEEVCNINLFLSNFSEQNMPAYDEFDMAEEWDLVQNAYLLDFAVRHMRINAADKLEHGDFMLGDVRLNKQFLPDVVWKYFKQEIQHPDAAQWNQTGDYYYWNENDGFHSGGFVCLNRVDDLGEGRYAVRFDVYGENETWNNDVCAFSAVEAAQQYEYCTSGMAVIAVEGGRSSLSDRSTWRLERWITA